ncbi:DUF4329 domain-containing protein [Aurantiacibacter sp. MUD61]|uniref:DUF4329 domain-containing protein n=1 Tax=Aurantiacibacter sp. MUD61 TaxID=3009083 RepID=UPI0022EFFC7D|nr:DUF4329 domain-containing protein [Aurantiacibacter sp. MUD61]
MSEGRTTIVILAVCAALWAGVVLNRSGENLANEVYEATVPTAEVTEFARQQLGELQQRSFNDRIELCGLIAENAAGELVSRTVRVGDTDSCSAAYFDARSLFPRAIYHTHGSFNPRYDSEVPSEVDVAGAVEFGLDGYVATPGGRFWRVNAGNGIAEMVCGESCLPQDPAYDPCSAPAPEQRYTVSSLQARDLIVNYDC